MGAITSERAARSAPALTNEINVTPMIDVLLVLLIIFMAAIPSMRKSIDVQLPDPRPSPLDRTMSRDLEARYRAALSRLTPGERDLVVGHIELAYNHAQLGHMTGRSPHAARMALRRAIARLAILMREH